MSHADCVSDRRPYLIASGAAPGLFTAVHEVLGLELKATRAPTDVFVIDVVTQPTQN
jgi:uncharacterized protein (TIGR03435 family)